MDSPARRLIARLFGVKTEEEKKERKYSFRKSPFYFHQKIKVRRVKTTVASRATSKRMTPRNKDKD